MTLEGVPTLGKDLQERGPRWVEEDRAGTELGGQKQVCRRLPFTEYERSCRFQG